MTASVSFSTASNPLPCSGRNPRPQTFSLRSCGSIPENVLPSENERKIDERVSWIIAVNLFCTSLDSESSRGSVAVSFIYLTHYLLENRHRRVYVGIGDVEGAETPHDGAVAPSPLHDEPVLEAFPLH